MKKPTLIDGRLTLRPFMTSDISALLEINALPINRYLTGSAINDEERDAPIDEHFTMRIRDWYTKINYEPDRIDLAITYDNQCVGEIVVNEWDFEMNSANLCLTIHPDYWNFGIGKKAILLVMFYLETNSSLHRLELEVYDFNPRARYVYESIGFTYEGTKRHAFQYNSTYHDIHFYSFIFGVDKLNRK